MFGGSLQRELDFRSNRGSRWLWLLPALLVILDPSKTSASTIDCCPENTSLLESSTNCSDGSLIRLNCNNGFYSLYPSVNHFDEFSIVEHNGPRLEFLHNYDSIPANRFCVSGINEADRTALICFEDDPNGIAAWRYILFGTLSVISAFFLLATLTIYALLPELRDIQDKAMTSVVAFLAISYILLAIEQIRPHPYNGDIICVPLAFLLYWAFLSAFFWMNLVAFNVWKTVWFRTFPIKDNDLFPIYCGIGSICPSFFLLAALITHHTDGDHLKPGFGENTCWFVGNTETWVFFYGPISFLLMLNIFYLGLTCWRLWYEYRGYNGHGLKALRFNCLLYGKLILVMGITWIFEVISFADSPRGNNLYWYATDILNSLQGLIIFVLLVLTRKRVKRLLARRKLFGISYPKSWAAYDEEDEIMPAIPVAMELSIAP